MLIFETPDGKQYIYIHIPKNCGTYLREVICTNYKVIKNHWGYNNNLDMAHLPYSLHHNYNKTLQLKSPLTFIAWVRNPYNRVLSAFFHLNKALINSPEAPKKFKEFVDTKLSMWTFEDFNPRRVHYYPQHRFLTDENNQIPKNIIIYNLDNYHFLSPKPDVYFKELVNRGYPLDLYYNKKQILTINRLYERDFRLFGFKMYVPN